MERANKDLENYLRRRYVSWKQGDWAQWLSVAEFAANTTPSAMTGILPFHAVYGYEPCMDFDIPTGEPESTVHNPNKFHARLQAEALAKTLKETAGDLREAIQTSQAQVSSRENEKRHDPTLVAGDLSYLMTKHLSRNHPTVKLDYCWTGPCKVEAVHGGSAKLSLPASSKIHPTVNLSYLRQFANDPLPGQVTDAESPDPVIAGQDASEDESEVTGILDARIHRQYCGGRHLFRAAWLVWPDHSTWNNADDGEFSHARDALDEFYALVSTKVYPPHSAEASLPYPPTDKSWDEPFFPEGGGVMGRRPSSRPLQTPMSPP